MESIATDVQPPGLGEYLAQLAQDAAAIASDIGVWLSFDYVGPSLIEVHGASAFIAAASALLTRALHSVEPGSGSVFFTTHVWSEPMSSAHHVRITVAHTARPVAGAAEVTRRANALRQSETTTDAPIESVAAYMRESGARYWEDSLFTDGTVSQLEVVLRSRRLPDPGDAEDLSSPQAWLIGSPPHLFDRMAMRLQRDGWIIRLVQTIPDAKQLLSAGKYGAPSPALVVATDAGGIPLDEYSAWSRELPADTRCIWGHATELAPSVPTGSVEPARLPLSPAAVAELRDVARDWQTRHFSESASAPLDANGNPRLLLVEDHPVNQILAVEMLRALGYDADIASDGREAIEYCQRFRPSAVLMDLDMPIMDGLEAARRLLRLESNDPRPHVPIIALTTATERRRECADVGMDGFVAKPLELLVLSRELARLVR